MKRLLYLLVFVLGTVAVLNLSPSALGHVLADTPKNEACAGIGLAGSNCSGAGTTQLNSLLADIVNLISIAIGVATVVMIMVAGFKFITSGGDSSKVASAKTTIVYALIGIVIVASAQVVVHYVLAKLP